MNTFLAVRIALFLITTKITRRFPDAPKRIIKAYNVINDPKVHGATRALYFQSFTISFTKLSMISRSRSTGWGGVTFVVTPELMLPVVLVNSLILNWKSLVTSLNSYVYFPYWIDLLLIRCYYSIWLFIVLSIILSSECYVWYYQLNMKAK